MEIVTVVARRVSDTVRPIERAPGGAVQAETADPEAEGPLSVVIEEETVVEEGLVVTEVGTVVEGGLGVVIKL